MPTFFVRFAIVLLIALPLQAFPSEILHLTEANAHKETEIRSADKARSYEKAETSQASVHSDIQGDS